MKIMTLLNKNASKYLIFNILLSFNAHLNAKQNYSIDASTIKMDSLLWNLKKMNSSDSLKKLKYFDPSEYLPFAQPKFLFVNGNKDAWFYVNACHKGYSLIKPEQRTISIFSYMKYSHLDGSTPEEINCFFESELNNRFPLVKVGKTSVLDSVLSVPFQTSITITSASFYYSNDTNISNSKREWKDLKSIIDPENKTISCKKPDFRVGFFTMKDVRNMSVPTEFIFN